MHPVTVEIDATHQRIFYRDFIIEESIDGWEWTHERYDRVSYPVTGTCQTPFQAIAAVDDWHTEEHAA